jgi:hypothetical protein
MENSFFIFLSLLMRSCSVFVLTLTSTYQNYKLLFNLNSATMGDVVLVSGEHYPQNLRHSDMLYLNEFVPIWKGGPMK